MKYLLIADLRQIENLISSQKVTYSKAVDILNERIEVRICEKKITIKERPECKRCEIKAISSKGFGNAFGKPDIAGTREIFAGGGSLIDCWKCPNCGHSWI